MFPKLDRTLERVEGLLERVEQYLPRNIAPDWKSFVAYRWRREQTVFGRRCSLVGVAHPHVIRFADLKDIDDQKSRIEANTRQFVMGRPANNVLLTGARGTGKSSLVKAALHEFSKKGLRLIEVDRADMVDLPDIADLVARRPERFIIFSDDLSFEANDPGYKALKSVLDGGISVTNDNLLVYATSNRRHLMPEKMSENLETKHTEDGEIHPGETTEEKISLSERFGLWLSFYPFDQDQYLAIVKHWVTVLTGRQAATNIDAMQRAALLWALERGSRSGRVAYQFARDWAGAHSAARSPVKTSRRK
ncbi:MAG: ATP-binding protein [Burkholderiales bacterium]|nr:ATP-binding protein [Burkholderiales bacterium]